MGGNIYGWQMHDGKTSGLRNVWVSKCLVAQCLMHNVGYHKVEWLNVGEPPKTINVFSLNWPLG